MPGTNLTQQEAATRAALLDVTSYAIDLDLTTGDTTFASTTTLRFTCSRPGADTFADLVDAAIHQITLNGVDLDPAAVYADSRIALSGLQAENELVVRADCRYSRSGEGLHRFVDPADDRVYLYSQFEVPDARRVFTTFEQPDLKSSFAFTVTTPEEWTVISVSPTPEPERRGDGTAVWRFEPTPRISTYITAIVAGEYHGVFDTYEGPFGTVPLGHYCRQSLAEYLDADDLFTMTKQAMAFYEEQFQYAYPFAKYDQLYVPEYNMGGMENAGCVTIRDEYLPRSRQPRSFYEFRCSVITHELAHMWFGDLVTMKWWNDLWLNEAFAEWACYWCEAQVTEFTDAWTGFANARKQTGYRADSLPSTHPIAPEIPDLHAIEVNFDMITYAKGASVLKQLVAWVGIEGFVAGLRQYFKQHEFGNTTFADLLAALERASGRELTSWAAEWLQTSGTNTLTPAIELDDAGNYTRVVVHQSAPSDHPTLRRHRLGIGLYDLVDGALTRREYVEIDVEGAETEVKELVGAKQPDLLLLNDDDLTFAKIRLDERSLATAIEHLSDLDDSLARALVWSACWDMCRDAEMPITDYTDLVLGNIGQETDAWGVTRIPALTWMGVTTYSAPATRADLVARWEQGMRRLMLEADPGSDHQLTFARAYAAAATSDAAITELEGLLDGSFEVPGLAVDADLRWALVGNLARVGRADDARIDAELALDNTISGQEKAAAARASMPTAEAKETAWQRAVVDNTTPNETQRSIVMAFARQGQDDLLRPYVQRYLDAVATMFDVLGSHKGSVVLEYIFPRGLASPELLAQLDAWLGDPATTSGLNAGALRYVTENRAEVARAVAAQECDARR